MVIRFGSNLGDVIKNAPLQKIANLNYFFQDAYVHVTLIKKWDICPGDALLSALGGKMTTLGGEEIDYSGQPAQVKNMGGVLATMHNHDQFVEKLKDTMVTIK